MSTVKVSIVIPVYNLEAYLHRCLDSVLQQTLQEIEIICINDASTDGSLAILEEYRNKDPRVQVFTVEKCGQGLIRNMGINLAKGAYTGFVDGDDYVDHTMFERLYTEAVRTESDIAFCYARCLDPEGKVVKAPYFDEEWKRCGTKGGTITFTPEEVYPLLSYITVVAWNKIYKSSFLKQYDIHFGSGIIHEDIPFYYLAMLRAGRVTLVREFLYCYSTNRLGSTTNAVMSTRPRMIHILHETREKITPWLNHPVVAKQYFRFEVTQLLSFLIYAFHRHEVGWFTKRRFFCMISREFNSIEQEHLALLSLTDRMQFRIIKNKYLKLYLVKKLLDMIRYNTKDFKRFRGMSVYFARMTYYHTRFYIGKLFMK